MEKKNLSNFVTNQTDDNKFNFWQKTKKLGKRFLIGSVITASAPFILNSVSIPVVYGINRYISQDNRAAVLSTGFEINKQTINKYTGFPEYLMPFDISSSTSSKIFKTFLYTPIILRQNIEGYHVNWYDNPSKKEAMSIIANPNYKSIVVIGHGARSIFEIKKGHVTCSDIIDRKVSPKESFVQHTCGGGNFDEQSLSDVLHAKKGYSFEGILMPSESWFYAWQRLFKGYGKEFAK